MRSAAPPVTVHPRESRAARPTLYAAKMRVGIGTRIGKRAGAIRERVRRAGSRVVVRTANGWRHSGMAGVAMTLGPRLAALPRTLAQMPDVRQALASRGARLEFTPRALWERIPPSVKAREADVMAFLGKRHLSHIKSKHLHPELAGEIKNVLFEKWQWNLERGSQNMKPWEVARLRLNNFAEGAVRGARANLGPAVRGASWAVLMELPVTAAENIILVKGQGKTSREAWRDAARDVGKSAAAGAAGPFVAKGIAIIGVPMGPAVVVPIAVAGAGLYTWSAAKRIREARAKVSSRGADALRPSAEAETLGLLFRPGQGRRRTRRWFDHSGNPRRYRFPRRNLPIPLRGTRRFAPRLAARPTGPPVHSF